MKNKQKKVTVFEPDMRLHFLDMATSPLGKRLSRAGYTEEKHKNALLHLFGFNLEYEIYEEMLDPQAIMRSDYTKDIFTGGSIFVGYKRSDFNIKSLERFVYGDGVDDMFDLISGKE